MGWDGWAKGEAKPLTAHTELVRPLSHLIFLDLRFRGLDFGEQTCKHHVFDLQGPPTDSTFAHALNSNFRNRKLENGRKRKLRTRRESVNYESRRGL